MNKRSQLLVSVATGAGMILVALAASASANKVLSGLWTGEDDLAINFDEQWVDLGPDTGCKIKSLKPNGTNRWHMRIACGVADTDGTFQADTTLLLKGSTLILTDKDGSRQLRR